MLAFSNILNFTVFLIQMKVNAEMCFDGHDCIECTQPINFGAAYDTYYNCDLQITTMIMSLQNG